MAIQVPALGWLAALALVPLVLATDRCPRPRVWLLWPAWGLLTWMGALSWLPQTLVQKTSMGWPGALSVLVLYCLYSAAPYGFFGFLLARRRALLTPGRALVGAVWLTALVAWLPTPIPGHLAHLLYRYPVPIQLAEIGGSHLVLLAVHAVNLLLAAAIAGRRQRGMAILLLLAAAGLPLVYGELRLDRFHHRFAFDNSLSWSTVAAVQPNVPIGEDSSEAVKFHFARLAGLTAGQANGDTDLAVWPELPLTYSCITDKEVRRSVRSLAERTRTPVLFYCGHRWHRGPTEAAPCSSGPCFQSIAEAIGADGSSRGVYAKRRPAPVFEYTPGWWPPWMGRQRGVQAMPGTGPTVLDIGKGLRVAPLICFEEIVPEVAQEAVAQGANLLVGMSNDSWLGEGGLGARMHFMLALFRAVELRRSMVRVTNSGIGAHLLPTGEPAVGTETPLFAEAATKARMPLVEDLSLYSRIGWAFPWFLGGLALVLLPWMLSIGVRS